MYQNMYNISLELGRPIMNKFIVLKNKQFKINSC